MELPVFYIDDQDEFHLSALKLEMKNRFQSVDFKGIDDFLDFLPDGELQIVTVLRKLILECIPGCVEKLNYNVPFYKRRKGICFIWPASVIWGKKVTYEGVRIGFNQGYKMRDEINFLERGTRKQVYWKTYHSVNEIDANLLKAYIFEAAEIDRMI